MNTKTCIKCHLEKDEDEFPPRLNRCRECIRAYKRNWNKTPAGRECRRRNSLTPSMRAARARWQEKRAADPAFRARRKKYRADWLQKNKEVVNQKIRQYRQTQAGRESNRRAVNKRRGRLDDGDCTLTHQDWDNILARFGNHCVYCGVLCEILEQDHVVPLSRGGKHILENVVPACRSCNARKNDALLSEWKPDFRFQANIGDKPSISLQTKI